MAAGPPLGGLLIAVGGWRLTFLVNVPLAIAGLWLLLAISVLFGIHNGLNWRDA